MVQTPCYYWLQAAFDKTWSACRLSFAKSWAIITGLKKTKLNKVQVGYRMNPHLANHIRAAAGNRRVKQITIIESAITQWLNHKGAPLRCAACKSGIWNNQDHNEFSPSEL
jgi:hypothetical protein